MQVTASHRPGARRREMALPRIPSHLGQIDLLKGFAIIAVLCTHSLPPKVLVTSASVFYIGQAVPVFVVLMGLNATGSLWRHGLAGLRGLYSPSYVLSRIDRLYVPFLCVFAVATVVAVANGTATPRGLVGGLVTGVLPVGGPGNYFITFAFQFAVLFPVYYWAYRRVPRLTTGLAFVVAAAFELTAPHISRFDATPYIYSAALPRFLPFLALGVMLADYMIHGRGLPRWWWLAGAISLVYLEIVHLDANAFPLADQDWRRWGQTFASAFYPALLVAAGLRWLPRRTDAGAWKLIATLGVASYEIFLVQILWFALFSHPSAAHLPADVVACCLLGYALSRLLRHVPSLRARSARARVDA